MQDASTCEEVVVVPAEFLFRVVPVDRKGTVAVNIRFVHHPITETAEHLDNGKLALEWKSIELFEHLLRIAVRAILAVEWLLLFGQLGSPAAKMI